jgi:hypothetical protein
METQRAFYEAGTEFLKPTSRPTTGVSTSRTHNSASTEKIQRTSFKEKKKLRGFGPLANYADRATAASWRSSTNFFG